MKKFGTPLEQILSELDYKETGEGQYQANCPAHSDIHPSLSIKETEPGGKVLLYCHRGCNYEDILKALGLTLESLYDKNGKSRKKEIQSKMVAFYDYVDELGKLSYQVVRYEPKGFKHRHPNGDGRWLWNLHDYKPLKKYPYHLPEVIKAINEGSQVLIVEGEKDVDNLFKLGFTATTNSGGAGKWNAEHSKWLKDADVVIIPDNDYPGRNHARIVADSLKGIAKSIKTLTLPGLPPKGDVSDWIDAGGTFFRLRELIEEAKEGAIFEEPQISNTIGCSDSGNSLRFVAKYGDKVRYCNEWDTWFIYDGKRWQADRKLEVQDMAKSIAQDIYIEAAKAITLEERAKLSKHALRTESDYSIKGMLKLVASDPNIAITHDSFDEDQWLFNVENGTINLKTGKLLPHNERHLLTKLAPVKYDPNASSELWRNFLRDVTGDNEEFDSFLQKAVGYSMTGDTSEEVLFFIYGPTATGKSTFLEAVKSVLGDYNKIADFESFLHHDNGSSHSDDIAALEGARMVVSVEVNEGKRLAEGLVKQISSGDPIPCRRIYGRSYTYYPQMKLWLAANHKPRVSAEDSAMWRRILTLPFDKTVPEERRDKTLKKKLKDTEAVGPAILTWMVKGCIGWQQEGLNPPSVVKEATQGYRKSQDIIGEFIEDTIEFSNMETLSRSSVYQEYKNWCEKNGERAVTNTMLTQKLHERGWKDAGRIRSELHFDGVKMKDKIMSLPQPSDASNIDLGYPTQKQLDGQMNELLGHDL